MKTLFEMALDSLPSTLRSTFLQLYFVEQEKDFRQKFNMVMKELLFDFAGKSFGKALVHIKTELDADYYFLSSTNGSVLEFVSWETQWTREYKVLCLSKDTFLKSNSKMTLIRDTMYFKKEGIIGNVEELYEDWCQERDEFMEIIST